jgi:EmrB/QacA subfamily drug resistance transporter
MKTRIIVPLIVACALFMENMDSTVITTSLPAIALDLGEDPIALKLALTSYLISLAVFIPISGWMADRYGARTIFCAAIVVFTVASALCGFATSLIDFVLYRALQGIGGAMMVPVGRLVVLRSVPKHEYVRAFTWLVVPAMVGPLIGPPLGGFITTYLNWRWIFWINIPIGILGILLAMRFIANVKERNPLPLDKLGFVLSGIGLSGLAFGMATFGQHLLAPVIAGSLLAAGLVFTAAFVFHAQYTKNPLLNLNLLKIQTFNASVLGGSLFRIGIGGFAFMLPLLFQIGFGMTPFQSGMLTLAGAIGAMTMRTSAGLVVDRFGIKRVIVLNGIVAAFFIAVAASFTPNTPHYGMFALLLAGGFFRSLQFTSVNVLAYADVEKRDMSHATAITSVAQQIALSTGVAVAAMTLDITRSWRGDAAILPQDFPPVFIVLGVVASLSVIAFLKLPRNAGASLTRKEKVIEATKEPDPHA